MRGGDGGPESHVLALPALWVGILYDAQSKAAAMELINDWTLPEMIEMRDQVTFISFQAPPISRIKSLMTCKGNV